MWSVFIFDFWTNTIIFPLTLREVQNFKSKVALIATIKYFVVKNLLFKLNCSRSAKILNNELRPYIIFLTKCSPGNSYSLQLYHLYNQPFSNCVAYPSGFDNVKLSHRSPRIQCNPIKVFIVLFIPLALALVCSRVCWKTLLPLTADWVNTFSINEVHKS